MPLRAALRQYKSVRAVPKTRFRVPESGTAKDAGINQGQGMTRIGVMVSCSLIAAFGAACDRQVETNYQGEPLMQIHGSVVIPQGLQSSALVPSIAWFAIENQGKDNEKHYLRISDVGFTGDFPGGFTLDIYDPAPADALIHDIPGEPAYADGRITAVPASYPRVVNTRSIPNGCGEYCILNMVCPGVDYDFDPDASHDQCAMQNFDCRKFANNDMVAELDLNTCSASSGGGDARLAFGGVSKNVGLAYFSAPVAADTLLAERYNNGEAIPAGYHVYRVDRLPVVVENAADYVPSEAEKCWEKAEAMALGRYNQEHSKNFLPSETWELESGGYRDEYYDFQRTFYKVRRELGCARPPTDLTPLELSTDSITIELGIDAGF